MRIILTAICILISTSVFAISMPDTLSNAVRGGLELYEMTDSGRDVSTLLNYRVSYYQTLPLPKLRLIGDISYMPDRNNRSNKINIYHDWIRAFAGLEVSYPYLFRFHATVAPSFIYRIIRYDIHLAGDSQKTRFSETDFGFVTQLGIDYAFNPKFEFSLTSGLQYRFYDQKTDFNYGLACTYNL